LSISDFAQLSNLRNANQKIKKIKNFHRGVTNGPPPQGAWPCFDRTDPQGMVHPVREMSDHLRRAQAAPVRLSAGSAMQCPKHSAGPHSLAELKHSKGKKNDQRYDPQKKSE
jgi:hypothetical protein